MLKLCYLRIKKIFVPIVLSAPLILSAQGIDELPALLMTVWENHPNLKAKRSDKNAALAGVTVAERQFWPTPSITNDVGPEDRDGRKNATTARVSYPVFTGGQLTADLEIAELRNRISESDLEITGRELLMQFVDLYRTWWFHSVRIESYRESLEQMDQLRQMLARRSEAGVSARLDLAQANLQWQRMQDENQQAYKQRDQALADMVTFGRQKMNPVFHPLTYWPKTPYSNIDDLTERVLDTHPSMNLAGWQIDLAQAELKKSSASSLPTVSLRVEKQFGSYLGSLAPGSRIYLNSQFSMGAGLTALPLQEQALARAKTAELQAYSSSLTLATQVQKLWHDRSQAWEKIITLRDQLKLQKELADAGIRLFTAGRRSWQDLLGLQRELYQLQATESEAQAAYLAADWRIHLLANTLPMFSFPSN